MFDTLPKTAQEFMIWNWSQIEPYYQELAARDLNAASIDQWLRDWTRLSYLLGETYARLSVATTVDTTDEAAVRRFHSFLSDIAEPSQPAEQQLKQKLLDSGLQPQGFEVPLRYLRTEAALFTPDNVPLFTQEQKLGNEYDRINGAQTVIWEGEEKTLIQLKPLFQSDDRALREKVWHVIAARRLQDREELNALWVKFMDLRRQMARNAGYENFRDYRWQDFKRFDYTPEDCLTFHAAIEEAVVPAANRIYQRQRRLLGVDRLRPWDLDRDGIFPPSRPPLHPFRDVAELDSKAETIFRQVDPQLGDYFAILRRDNLLDLDNRKGKAPGGYQAYFPVAQRPFIFMNAVGLHDDVQTLLHEGGHAFHAFESAHLPYSQQLQYGAEIAEVASMSMELLAAPYLTQAEGGYYSEADAARARSEHLESILLFWPYMAVVDAFQHWVYTHHDEAADPAKCDTRWTELSRRFIPSVDWSGLADVEMTGWHRKQHIFQIPFYYVDYGLAQVGAVQVWRNSLRDQAEAVKQYRYALSLGGTRPLPELFAAAGAKFAFDAATLGELVDLIEDTLAELEAKH